MPGHIAGDSAVFVEHDEAAGVIKTGRTRDCALAPWTELIKRTLTAGEKREIANSLRPQDDGHEIESYQSAPGTSCVTGSRCRSR